MSQAQLIIILVAGLALLLIAGFAWFLINSGNGKQVEFRGLMGNSGGRPGTKRTLGKDNSEDRIDQIKKKSGRSSKKSSTESLEVKLFKAGFYLNSDKNRFKTFRIISGICVPIVLTIGAVTLLGDPMMTISTIVLGVFIGLVLPNAWLDKQIGKRKEEIMYYLPLVIEQVSIGVSSSLDIGPCIAQIVTMAEERDTHNAITEMFMHVEKLIKSGLNLEDSLIEVGDATGLPDVKHAFMFLAQCAKHGGEVSKQLQELADAVMVQRQVEVEARISALPVKATLPLTLVFFGFFMLLFSGLMVRMLSALGSTL